jgi:5'-3' exonuclease
MNDERFNLAIIDADSMLYAIAYKYNTPALCRKQVDKTIDRVMNLVGADSAVVYVKGPNNFRFQADPEYKAQRKDTIPPEIKALINDMYDHCDSFAMQSVDGEADDYCTFTARMARMEGKSHVTVHIDKDLDCIPGWHFNFKTDVFREITFEFAYRFMMQQFLTGDSTDNIKGLKGIGPMKAQKAMDGYSEEQLWDCIVSTWQKHQGADWKDNFVRCVNCIYLRSDADDLRPLTFEELKERLTWKKFTDTGYLLQIDPMEPTDSSTEYSDQQDDNTSDENSW